MPPRSGRLVIFLATLLLPTTGCVGFGLGFSAQRRSGTATSDYNPRTGERAGDGKQWAWSESWTDLGGEMGVMMGATGGPSWARQPGREATMEASSSRDLSLDIVVKNLMIGGGIARDGVTYDDNANEYRYWGPYARLGLWFPRGENLALHLAASFQRGDLCIGPVEDSGNCRTTELDAARLEAGVNVHGYFSDDPNLGVMLRLKGSFVQTLWYAPVGFSAFTLGIGAVALF